MGTQVVKELERVMPDLCRCMEETEREREESALMRRQLRQELRAGKEKRKKGGDGPSLSTARLYESESKWAGGWTYSDDLLVRLRVFGQGGKDEARFRCRHLSRQAQARDLVGEIHARQG